MHGLSTFSTTLTALLPVIDLEPLLLSVAIRRDIAWGCSLPQEDQCCCYCMQLKICVLLPTCSAMLKRKIALLFWGEGGGEFVWETTLES